MPIVKNMFRFPGTLRAAKSSLQVKVLAHYGGFFVVSLLRMTYYNLCYQNVFLKNVP